MESTVASLSGPELGRDGRADEEAEPAGACAAPRLPRRVPGKVPKWLKLPGEEGEAEEGGPVSPAKPCRCSSFAGIACRSTFLSLDFFELVFLFLIFTVKQEWFSMVEIATKFPLLIFSWFILIGKLQPCF